jgi:sulfoquinovosidase
LRYYQTAFKVRFACVLCQAVSYHDTTMAGVIVHGLWHYRHIVGLAGPGLVLWQGGNRPVRARFAATDDGFELRWGERVLATHSTPVPAVGFGIGAPDITMVRGNFRIEDSPQRFDTPVVTSLSEARVILESPGAGRCILDLQETDGRLVILIGASDARINRVWLRLTPVVGESVWGGGEQMSHLCLNGRRFPMWTSEPGVGRDKSTDLTRAMDDAGLAGGDYWTTNYPQPTFLTSTGHAVHVDTTSYSVLDFSDPAAHCIEVWSGQVRLELFASRDQPRGNGLLLDLVSQLASRFGRPATVPGWVTQGAIIGLKAGNESFERLDAIRAAGVPVSGVWCEDWVGIRQTSFGRRLFWDWQWSRQRYPDLPDRIARLKRDGIAFLGYVNPYLAVDGSQYQEARRQGYLALRLESDEPYHVDFGEFDAAVVDFTNPAAFDWFADEIIGRQMLDFGIDGWMADFGEYLPVDLRLHDGSDPMDAHNLWPVLWARVNAEGIARRGKTGEATFFMRAGYSGVQCSCPLLWAGDQCVDFSRHDGINTVITAALSAGLVGNCVSHADVGGYTSINGLVRTSELMTRWIELAAFTPVFRTHEGNRPDDNLQIDSTPEILAHCAAFVRVFQALGPYRDHVLAEANVSGLPVQRPLFLHHPRQEETFTCQDQFLLGQDLLVAPVVEAGVRSRHVLLPGSGDWVHVWSGGRFGPGGHTVSAPHGEPPVFYRAESPFARLFSSLRATRDGVQ